MKNDAMHKYSDVPNVIKRATELTWSMANLSPPVSFESEREFSEDLYDVTDVDNLLGSNDINYVVEYRRPILFFGPLGIVGHRGSVAIHPPVCVLYYCNHFQAFTCRRVLMISSMQLHMEHSSLKVKIITQKKVKKVYMISNM